jgi:hypothetical protein
MLTKYGKTLAAIVTALLIAGASVTSGDGHVSGEEWFQVVTALGNALLVYLVPAVPQWPWMKTAVSAVLAGLAAASSLVLDGISTNDIINVILAIIGVALVAMSPAKTETRSFGV